MKIVQAKNSKKNHRVKILVLTLTPIVLAIAVWLSALAFVPVPWPDDSAFYFVAKYLFQWPPRWVMIPQAPFEPTYRIFNFNTMPLYPILIGLGRWIGIDGSFLLKIWPLSAWALSGSLLAVVLFQQGLPFFASLGIALFLGLNPAMRWASVLVRPESLVGLFGMALVLGLTFGFPKRLEPKKIWDPVSALLALGAYSHFNAVHLIFPVLVRFIFEPKRMLQILWKTVLYLSPWIATILFYPDLFIRQMQLQWSRLNVRNDWLDSPNQAISGIFQNMGSPEGWPPVLFWAATGIWALFFASLLFFLALPMIRAMKAGSFQPFNSIQNSQTFSGLPALAWTLAAIWLFHSKPEVWFTYYFHVSLGCLCGIFWLKLLKSNHSHPNLAFIPLRSSLLGSSLFIITSIFAFVNLTQAQRLGSSPSWHWSTYYELVDCVDEQLTKLKQELKPQTPFRVWCPTFPDITIELSRKHPEWEFTRTNDFWNQADLAIQHGWETDAVVVTETIGIFERFLSGKPEEHPEVQSNWMLWPNYFLNRLWIAPGWKPNRYLCQKGRWQAFLFMKEIPSQKH